MFLLDIISSQVFCLKLKQVLPLQAACPLLPKHGNYLVFIDLSQNVTILVKVCWKDKVSDVNAVPLHLDATCKNMPERDKCSEQTGAHTPHLSQNDRGKCTLENKCQHHSRFLDNAVPILSRAIVVTQRLSSTNSAEEDAS